MEKIDFIYKGVRVKAESYTRVCKWLGVKGDDFLSLKKKKKLSYNKTCLYLLRHCKQIPTPCDGVKIFGTFTDAGDSIIDIPVLFKHTKVPGMLQTDVDQSLNPRVSSRKNLRGHYVYTDYTCPICSHDMFVSKGLCTGVFTIRTSDLKDGKRSCRCSSSYRYTKEQRLYMVKEKCKDMGIHLVDYVCPEKHNAKNFKLSLQCNKGHIWESTVDVLIHKNCGCPFCAGHDQKYGYINLIKDRKTPVGLKFGITRDLDHRLKAQNRRNVLNMFRICAYEFPTSEACKQAEQECKTILKCGIFSKREVPDGHTETVALTAYEQIVSIYKKYGGSIVEDKDYVP